MEVTNKACVYVKVTPEEWAKALTKAEDNAVLFCVMYPQDEQPGKYWAFDVKLPIMEGSWQ